MARGVYLLENVSADTDGSGVSSDGGIYTLGVQATSFGGGTVALELSNDGGTTWIQALYEDGTNIEFTANGVSRFQVNVGYQFRATLTGSTSPSGVYVRVD